MLKTRSPQYLINIFLSLLAFSILIFSFIHQSQEQVNQSLGIIANQSNPSPLIVEQTSTVPVHNNYQLPHPGILPTNPFYMFKMIRDRIGLILTTSPDQRAALLLHYANKRISAARMLATYGLENQAIETATKAETYLNRAINESRYVSVPLLPVWFDGLKQAALKHEEVIEEIRQLVQEDNRDQLNHLYQNLDQYRLLIVSLSGQPFGYVRPEDIPVDQSSPATPSATVSPKPYM